MSQNVYNDLPVQYLIGKHLTDGFKELNIGNILCVMRSKCMHVAHVNKALVTQILIIMFFFCLSKACT